VDCSLTEQFLTYSGNEMQLAGLFQPQIELGEQRH
jgi:hypothetical protein